MDKRAKKSSGVDKKRRKDKKEEKVRKKQDMWCVRMCVDGMCTNFAKERFDFITAQYEIGD